MSDLNLQSSELANLTERTLGPVEKKINQFSLKAAGKGFQAFKRILGTITEPFFRTGMGERYYASGAFLVGMIIWVTAGTSGRLFASESSIAALLCKWRPFHFLAFIFQSEAFPVAIGWLMALFQARVGYRNIRESVRLQREGILHHSRSRGAAIWQNEGLAFLKIEAVLLFLNWPIAVLFGVGYGMNAMLKAAQDAAIRERYLDAVDKDIENKYLKDSALGNCPPEMTFLYHQIDPNIKPEVREKMASALVGETVSVVAKPPQKKKSSSPPPAHTESSEESEWDEKERIFVAENAPEAPVSQKGGTPLIPVNPESELGKMAKQNRAGISALSPLSSEEIVRLWTLGLKIRRFFILGMMIVVGLFAVFAISNFIQSHHWKSSAAKSVTAPVQTQSQTVATAGTPLTDPPVVRNQPEEIPQTVAQPVAPAPEVKPTVPPMVAAATVPVANPAPAAVARTTGQNQEQIIAQINGVVTNESAKVSEFKTTTDYLLRAKKFKISQTSKSMQKYLMEDFTRDQESIAMIVKSQNAALDKVPQLLQARLAAQEEDPQLFLEHLKVAVVKLEASRQQAFKLLEVLDAEIANATSK